MSGLILGIDLCDSYTQVSCYDPEKADVSPIELGNDENSCLIPTVICKQKGRDSWAIGAEAYGIALKGEGTMVDKLVKLLVRDGGATIEGVRYSAEDLLVKFLEKILELPKKKYNIDQIRSVAFSLQRLDAGLLDRLMKVCRRCGLTDCSLRILSHTECFAYFISMQPKEVWGNQTVVFDLSNAGLDYYELKTLRGRKPQVIEAERQALEEGFDLDLLENSMGEKMADTIMSACADRMLGHKLVSSVYLTGVGFISADWAPEFLKKVCNKRKVFLGQHLFSDGAAYVAYDSIQESTIFPYLLICEGRLASSISLYALHEGRNEQIMLASAGDNWYEAKSRAEFLLDDVHTLELQIMPFNSQRVEKISIPLDTLPPRPNKTTKIEVILSFLSEKGATVRIIDKGFGELYPASGITIRKDFLI